MNQEVTVAESLIEAIVSLWEVRNMNQEVTVAESLIEIVQCRCPHDLGDCDSAGNCPCIICHVPWTVRRVLLDVAPKHREPSSPVGLEAMECRCGHTCDHHDDYGCLWTLCQCNDMGERK